MARNLTKPHERYQRGALSDLVEQLAAEGDGETTLLIAGADGGAVAAVEAEADARLLLDGGAPPRAVQDLLAARHGMSRRQAYDLVLRLRDR